MTELESSLQKKEELEADIRSDERDQKEEWSKIEAILSKLKHSDERAVIRIRYHDRESWSTVAEVIFEMWRTTLTGRGPTSGGCIKSMAPPF